MNGISRSVRSQTSGACVGGLTAWLPRSALPPKLTHYLPRLSRGGFRALCGPPAEAQLRHSPDRLGDDRAVHLRGAGPAVAEDDRHLDDPEAALDRPVGHLDLEGVAAGADRAQVDRLENLAAEALEAAGQVLHVEAEDDARVGAAAAADRPPQRAPVTNAAAGHVARAEHQVGPLRRLQQPRQVGGVVREVRVHLEHQAGTAREGVAEAGDVGGAEAFLAVAMQDADVLVLPGQAIGDLPGPV